MLMPNSFEGIYVIHKYDFLIVVNGTINEFIKKEMALSIFVWVSINYGQRPSKKESKVTLPTKLREEPKKDDSK